MSRVATLVVLAIAGLAFAAPAPKDPLPMKTSSIVGRWELVSVDGERVDSPSMSHSETFDADGTRVVRLRISGKESETKARYKSDPTADPAQFDFPDDSGGMTIEGIYKVEGDTLTLCYQVNHDGPRPKEFKVTKDRDSQTSVCVYKRVKPKY